MSDPMNALLLKETSEPEHLEEVRDLLWLGDSSMNELLFMSSKELDELIKLFSS